MVYKGTKVFIFREEDQFNAAVQPVCAVIGGSLMYRLPRVQDENATFTDQEGQDESIRWFSRTGPQLEKANAVAEVVIPHLVKENATNVTIVLALEEQSLNSLNWEDTFPLLMITLEKVLLVNRRIGSNFNLVAAPIVYPNGDNQRLLHVKVAAHNTAVWAYNHPVRGVFTWKIWKFPLNKTSNPDSELRLAVEGMEHMILAPACYEFGEARVPSKNTMLKLRKTLRGIVTRGWQLPADFENPVP